MSETETSPPLAPEGTETETVAAPVIDKVYQKEQEKRATLERRTNERFDRIEALLEKVAAGRASPAQEDQLETLSKELDGEQGAELEKYNPGITKYLKAMAGKLKDSGKAAPPDERIQQLEQRLEAQEAFTNFMSDKPPEFRKAYREHQDQLMEELEAAGDTATEKELRIAMGQFTKQWFKDHAEGEDEPARTAPGRKSTIIPSTTGARKKVEELTPQAAVTRLQRPRQGDGNLLGISREDVAGRK